MVFLLLTIPLLGILVYQDFRTRSVSLLVMLTLFGLLCIQAFNEEHSIGKMILPFVFNIAFVVFQLLIVLVCFFVKNGKASSFIDGVIGMGDVVFMCICSMAFSTYWFLVFYVFSLLLSLVGTLLYKVMKSNKATDVPLVGYMAAVLVVCIVVKATSSSVDFYNDGTLLNFMNN